MKRKQRFLPRIPLLLILISLLSWNSWAFEVENVDLYVRLSEMEQAAPPQVIGERVLFTYKTSKPVRYVGMVFAHEDFTELHVFQRNQQGVYLYLYDAPEEENTLTYRYVVDGLWIQDPLNPARAQDRGGAVLSAVTLPVRLDTQRENPHQVTEGELRFIYYGNPGQRIYLSGSFNGWDPFSHRLHPVEGKSGVYETVIRVAPGEYYYHFVVDGRETPDPYNPLRRYDSEGNPVSYFRLRR